MSGGLPSPFSSHMLTWMLEVVRLSRSRALVYDELLNEAGIGNETRLKRRLQKEPSFLRDLGILDEDDIADIAHCLEAVKLGWSESSSESYAVETEGFPSSGQGAEIQLNLDDDVRPFKTELVFVQRRSRGSSSLSFQDEIPDCAFSSPGTPTSVMNSTRLSSVDPSTETLSLEGLYLSSCSTPSSPVAFSAAEEANDESRLSGSQRAAMDQVLSGRSVFITGAAGTGKSHLLAVLKKSLSAKGIRAAFTAPTGVAACHLGGLTLHAWAGIGTGDRPLEDMKFSHESRDRWRRTEVLIIDEVSMLSMELFDLLSVIGSELREDPRPFGGLQVVLCGDFFQLPPVKSNHFCFESTYWNQLISHETTFILETIYRQENIEFATFVNWDPAPVCVL